MKLMIILCAVMLSFNSFGFWSKSAKIEGNLSWNRGHWTCSMTNSKGRTLFISGVRFSGDKRRRGTASKWVQVKRNLEEGGAISITKNNVLPVSYVRNCYFYYRK